MGFVVQDWLMELLWGTAKFFLNPVFYLLIILAAYLGISRVKAERKFFHVRAENAYFELKQLIPLGFVIGIAISVVTIGAGVVIPLSVVAAAAIFTIGACWPMVGWHLEWVMPKGRCCPRLWERRRCTRA